MKYQDWQLMSKKNKLIPELRFPEFKNEGEWAVEKLSIITEVIMGSSPSSSSYNENRIGLPLLQGNADIKDRFSAPRIYTTEVTKECEIDDILLSVRAPVGTVAKSLHKACIGRGISALRALKPNSQEYLYQWLFSYEASWQKVSQGGTFDAVNSDEIRNLLVPIPKPKEQQKIAACLSSLDALIAAHNYKLQALKAHKKGLMQNLFPLEGENVPRNRFPEFEKDGEWVESRLGSISNVSSGGTPSRAKKEYWNGNIPWVSTTLIDYSEIKEAKEFITPLGLENSSTKIFPKGTILMAMYGQGKTRGKVGVLGVDAAINQACAAIVLKKGINTNFVFQNLASRYEEIRGISNQGGQENLSGTIIKDITIYHPSPKTSEQKKIAFCLSALDDLILAQTNKIAQLQLHKKGLMQRLFPKTNY